jgi:hypothetical protein
MLAFLFLVVNYLEGPSLLLLPSATWKGWLLFIIDVRYLKCWFFSSLLSTTYRGATFSLIAVSYLEGLAYTLYWRRDTWNAGFSLHCRQLPRGALFSLIDVSYLEERAFTLH